MGRVTRSSPDIAQVFKPAIFPLKPIFRNFVPLPIAILLVLLAVSGVSACRPGPEPAALPGENHPAATPTETELPARNSTPISKTVLPTPVPDDKIATNSGPDVSPEPPPSLQPFPDPPERRPLPLGSPTETGNTSRPTPRRQRKAGILSAGPAGHILAAGPEYPGILPGHF